MRKETTDPTMARCREAFERSGRTLDEVGKAMGYPPVTARKSVWQFLHKTTDPRLSMLRKFAAAVGVKVQDLIGK